MFRFAVGRISAHPGIVLTSCRTAIMTNNFKLRAEKLPTTYIYPSYRKDLG